MHTSALTCPLHFLNLIILRGVNTNSQHDINGWTALHWAAKRNHLNIVNLLCNHGADKNVTTNKGEVAAQLTSEGVIKVFFKLVFLYKVVTMNQMASSTMIIKST